MEEINSEFPFKTLDEFNKWLTELQQERDNLKQENEKKQSNIDSVREVMEERVNDLSNMINNELSKKDANVVYLNIWQGTIYGIKECLSKLEHILDMLKEDNND